MQLFGTNNSPNRSDSALFVSSDSIDNCNLAISIPQDNCAQGLEFPIPISGIENTNLGSDVELSEVRLIISHTWELDLRISLRSPSGTTIPLSTENGTPSSSNAYGDVTVNNCDAYTAFTMNPCLDLLSLDDPAIENNFIGSFLPEGDFSTFNSEDPNGIWYLEVCDKDAGANLGRLEFVDLIFTEINCDAPENVQVSSINNASISVSWDPIPNTILTLVEVVPHGAAPSSDINSANGNIFQTLNSSSSTALELLEDTPYDVYVRTQCADGSFSKNACPIFVQTGCTTQAITLENDFDNQDICLTSCGASCTIDGLWSNVSYDDFDWFVGQGNVTGSRSGPSDDVSQGGKYVFIQTDNLDCQFNKRAILESTCLQISANQNSCHMSFYYHSFGSGIGTLQVEVLPQGSLIWEPIWTADELSEDVWFRAYLDLREYDEQNVKMRFVASGALNNNSNLALDEITFYGAQPAGSPSFIYYRDRDNDGFGNFAEPLALCSAIAPTGYVTTGGDCDDLDRTISPAAMEVGCNGMDENCNGMSDDNNVPSPISILQEVCSGENARLEIGGTDGYETQWFQDPFGNNQIGLGNPIELAFEAGLQNVYAQNVIRNGPGLRLTEVNFVAPYHLEIQSIGKAEDYSGWKIYVNSVLNGFDINGYNTTPWILDQMQTGEIRIRSRSDWANPILWPDSRPGWAMIFDQQGTIQDAIFWNWSDTEMASIDLNIEGRSYDLSNIPWQGSAMNVDNCQGTISLIGSEETNSFSDYNCQLIGSIGAANPNLDYATVCRSSLVSIPVQVDQSPIVDYVLDNDPCDNGSVSSGIELLISDGIGPFEYSWSNGSQEQNQNNLIPGDYNVTITGGNGCHTILEDITIGVSSSTIGIFTQEVQDVSCHGGEDGMVVVEVEGGAPPFQFNWIVGVARNEVFVNRDTLRGLAKGNYAVTVTDNNGCVSSTGFEVAEPEPVTVNVDTQLPTCQSSFDGFIQVQTQGGNPPYTYHWSNGRTTSTNPNLSFGSYTLTITDNNDCILLSDPIEFIPSIDTISLVSLEVNQVFCAGDNNGSIETNFEGGEGALSFFWDNGDTTQNLFNLEPGSYSLTVTDENQCEFFLHNIDIVQPLSSSISLNFNTTSTSCNGVCDAVLSTSVAGGNPPYTYTWSTGDSTSTLFDLCTGPIGLTITDELGCESVFDEEIFIEAGETDLLAVVSLDSITCFNSADGTISLTVEGGSSPYTYQWSHNSDDTSFQTDLSPGTYVCTIIDDQGCTIQVEEFVLTNPPIIILDSVLVERSPVGSQNGSIEIFLRGGRGNFNVTWFDANNIEVGSGLRIDNLGVGNYSFIAADQGGCTFERRNIVVDISTSVQTSVHLKSFELAPNPSSDFIFLDADFDRVFDLDLHIYNASGSLIDQHDLQPQSSINQRIDVSDYGSGVYFLVLWEDGKFIGRKSFVVD